MNFPRAIAAVLVASACASSALAAEEALLSNEPDAAIDLATTEGAALVQGQWRYHDASIVETEFNAAGPDGQPTGGPNRTYDYSPHAGWADFDDSSWEAIDPTTLDSRRAGGKLCFNWYRIRVTVPERVGAFETRGATLVFETSLDDYAEVWVDGELPRAFSQSGGSVVKGWNAPNRLVVGRDVVPGQKIQLAVFGINGPISAAPTNYIWMRTARLDFYGAGKGAEAGPFAVSPHEVNIEVVKLDPEIDEIVPPNPKLYKVASGFTFIEGPVWTREGSLLFSDPNQNKIYEYRPDSELVVHREKSGYDGADIGEYRQPGSNGLGLDAEGRLLVAEHGNRRIARIGSDGKEEVLASRFEGKRLNSPNDLVVKSDGSIYFTDPPFGLPKFYDDLRKELPFSGVFRISSEGKLELLSTDLKGPNGIDFSPDERFLYVTNWDPEKKVVMRYEVGVDGRLSNGKVFFDMTKAEGEEALDGIEVDEEGHLFVSGPGGIWVLAEDGRHLGTIRTPRLPANFAWGGEDGKSLYLTARSTLYRLPLRVREKKVSQWSVVRRDPRFDALVPRGAVVETVASGFDWVEGPAWDREKSALLFSNIPDNAVYRVRPPERASLFLKPSGYTGTTPFTGREPGSNGLAFDAEGRLVLCEHGDRRIARLELDGRKTTLADRYQGKRLNSPNDLVFKSDGSIYFTDPPFGLPGAFDDPEKELPFQGVYRLSPEGTLTLLTKELRAPNGIGFSPDEKTLYVSNADREHAVWMAFDVLEDGALGPGRVFFDATEWARLGRKGVPDGLDIDRDGNLFAAGPGGIHVIAPDGTHLGSFEIEVPAANSAWGEDLSDGSYLYIAADTAIYRIRTSTRGQERLPIQRASKTRS
jgi:gluconolactonase